jgi:hypothetical protein
LAILLAAQTEKQSRLWDKYPSLWRFSSDSNGIVPTKQPSNLKLKIGHVLFIEIAGYSKLLIISRASSSVRTFVRGKRMD